MLDVAASSEPLSGRLVCKRPHLYCRRLLTREGPATGWVPGADACADRSCADSSARQGEAQQRIGIGERTGNVKQGLVRASTQAHVARYVQLATCHNSVAARLGWSSNSAFLSACLDRTACQCSSHSTSCLASLPPENGNGCTRRCPNFLWNLSSVTDCALCQCPWTCRRGHVVLAVVGHVLGSDDTRLASDTAQRSLRYLASPGSRDRGSPAVATMRRSGCCCVVVKGSSTCMSMTQRNVEQRTQQSQLATPNRGLTRMRAEIHKNCRRRTKVFMIFL